MTTRFYADKETESFVACQRLLSALLPPHRLRALLAAADGSPTAALQIPREQVATSEIGMTEKQWERLREAATSPVAPDFLERAAGLGAWVIQVGDASYSSNLAPLMDAPPLLFVRGALCPEDAFSVAIVGSRRATIYGRGQADSFARAFAERGLTLISGGASGIDTAAHRGAMGAGGRTITVLGCGVDVTYPAENRALFAEIIENGGALISEFPLGTKPEPWRFPARNRIIAGMSRATVLIETPQDSGAMITARDAAEYGREVWAVPGPIEGGRSRGCHRLIQDGAGLADSPADVLRALGLAVEEDLKLPSPTRRISSTRAVPVLRVPEVVGASAAASLFEEPDGLTDTESRLIVAFGSEPRHADEAGRQAGLGASEVAVALTLLEMKGLLRREPGNLFVRRR